MQLAPIVIQIKALINTNKQPNFYYFANKLLKLMLNNHSPKWEVLNNILNMQLFKQHCICVFLHWTKIYMLSVQIQVLLHS